MKATKFIFTLFFVLGSLILFAQKGPNGEARKDKVATLKIAFFTNALDLTADEAQAFWPVYNQYQKELETLRKERREIMMKAKMGIDDFSDKEIESLVDGHIIFKQRDLDIRKKYHAEFKSVLTIKKVARLYKAEEEFKRMLVKRLKDNRGGQHRMPNQAR